MMLKPSIESQKFPAIMRLFLRRWVNTKRPLAVLLGSLCLATSALSADYDDADSDDMLKPEELHDKNVVANPANGSGGFVGAGLTFGQGRSSEDGSTPGVAYLFHLEPGYQVPTSSWHRLELSADLFTGRFGFRTNSERLSGPFTVKVDFGMMAKLGYGYSLGSGIMGLARLGVGPIFGSAEGEVNGAGVESRDSAGVVTQLGWMLLLPLQNHLDATGGFSLTHIEMDVGRLRGNGESYTYGRSLVANLPSLDLGVRYRF